MLRIALLLSSLVLSVGMVVTFGFLALAVCFGLCLLTVVISSAGVEEEQVALPTQPGPRHLASSLVSPWVASLNSGCEVGVCKS